MFDAPVNNQSSVDYAVALSHLICEGLGAE